MIDWFYEIIGVDPDEIPPWLNYLIISVFTIVVAIAIVKWVIF